MSADPEQDYFTDGITEDIITEMSRFHEIFVIARNSTFTYKGRSVDVRVVATELGVRYVLEGSIRKAADRVRVTGQLIDALTGGHIWAERYDRVLKDIFAVQEELTRSIVRAIAPQSSMPRRRRSIAAGRRTSTPMRSPSGPAPRPGRPGRSRTGGCAMPPSPMPPPPWPSIQEARRRWVRWPSPSGSTLPSRRPWTAGRRGAKA